MHTEQARLVAMSVSHPTSRDVYARRPVPGGVPSLSGIEFSLCAIRQQMSSSWAGTEVMSTTGQAGSLFRFLEPHDDGRPVRPGPLHDFQQV